MSSGKRIASMVLGMIIMVAGFFGGFIGFFRLNDPDAGTILLYMMVIPMVSFLIGAGIMMYGMKDTIGRTRFGLFGMMTDTSSDTPKEKTYIHEPPRFCTDCGAALSAEGIEWVGPLTVKCPYCGATHATEKREV